MKLKRWLDPFGDNSVDMKDVEKLESLTEELLERLECMSYQHYCGCKHPSCKRCEDDKLNEEVINKVKGIV